MYLRAQSTPMETMTKQGWNEQTLHSRRPLPRDRSFFSLSLLYDKASFTTMLPSCPCFVPHGWGPHHHTHVCISLRAHLGLGLDYGEEVHRSIKDFGAR